MSFTDAQLVDIRRFCGYPAFGGPGSTGFQNWRFFEKYGLLEFRLANLSTNEQSVVVTTYLANLYTLETAIPAASANLDTDQAAVWTHNKNEVRDRVALLRHWRCELCRFLGVPEGPGLAGGNAMRMVV